MRFAGSPSVSVVMPLYNEAATVAQSIAAVLRQSSVQEVIAVDDGSTDGSAELIESLSEPRIKLFRHETNRGKGAAVRTALSLAVAPIVLIQDADLEYDPADYPRLLEPILSCKADVVFGSRFLGASAHRVLYYWHSVANSLLTTLSNMATNVNLTDMETGFKVFRRDILSQLSIEEDRFGFEAEITAKVARLGARIYEVPVSYHGRTYAEGKKVRWVDGLSALRCILRYGVLARLDPPKPRD
jgi:glycosyltransferase involved in cell wall biosynthesis